MATTQVSAATATVPNAAVVQLGVPESAQVTTATVRDPKVPGSEFGGEWKRARNVFVAKNIGEAGLNELLGETRPDDVPEMEDASESSDGTQDSDEEDVFSLRSREDASLPKMYLDSVQMRWHAAIQDVTGLLRDDVHLPLEPTSEKTIFTACSAILHTTSRRLISNT